MRIGLAFARISVAAAALLAISPLSAAAAEHNVPNGIALSHYEGRVDAAREMNLTVVLKMHNSAEFDKVLDDLYDPASSRYHQWLSDKEMERYAPTAAEFATVKNELVRQGFTVVSADPGRFSIRVHGTAATVEKAFNTELNKYSYNGRVYQANARDAHLPGPAGELIDAVSGIERHQTRPRLSYVTNPVTGKQLFKRPLVTREDLASFAASLTDTPLTTSSTTSWIPSTAGQPSATYTGYGYTLNGQTGAFTPSQLESYYGVPFTQGSKTYDGTGQTIALVEGYGYANAEADANAAAKLFGLPALTSKNFEVKYPEGKPLDPNAAELTGWDGEIALDLQSSHAIAPGAKIIIVASSGQDNEDQLDSLNYVITNHLANTVSNSWENDSEILSGTDEEMAFADVLKKGAAQGISFQFSSGDGGDQGLGTPLGAVGLPANSPYVTAVGGTTVLNNPYSSTPSWITTGWGNDLVQLYYFGVTDPLVGYFHGGAGGGESQFWPRPVWQNKIVASGHWRMVPDVAALADPYTGFALVLTVGSTKYGEVIGGTSLASPIFTAIWAVADQYNGSPLGQAARAVATLKSGEITDVVAPTAAQVKYDLAGSITDSKGKHTYTRTTLVTKAGDEDNPGSDLSLYGQSNFISALWPVPGYGNNLYFAVTFGTDSSLLTGEGWDYSTGWGEPNGLPFIQGVTGKTTGAAVKAKE